MNAKLVQISNDSETADFELQSDNNERIVRYDVEFNGISALISYETEEHFKNQGYASYGLCLLRDYLFSQDILFLELINLSGDYSRKVAENAGFISRAGDLTYYSLSNPIGESILNKQMQELEPGSIAYQKAQKQLTKIQSHKIKEAKAQYHKSNCKKLPSHHSKEVFLNLHFSFTKFIYF